MWRNWQNYHSLINQQKGWIDGFSALNRTGFIEGFKASQQLNEKKFSEADLINYRTMYVAELSNQATIYRGQDKTSKEDFAEMRRIAHHKIVTELSNPKTFEIEIEETENTIKILRRL